MRIILALLCSLSLCCGQQIIDSYRFAAAAGVLLLDEAGASGATGAYSLRKVRAAHAGSAVLVRRSNDNATSAIGFTGNDLNTSALASHVGANSGYVVTWYDQSGNGRDLTNATAAQQPMIVNAGTLVTGSNGKPAIDFSSTQFLDSGIGVGVFVSATAFTTFSVFNADTTSNAGNIYDNDAVWSDTTGYIGLHLKSTTLQQFNYAGATQVASTTIATGTWYLAQSRHEAGNIYVKVNAVTEASAGSGSTDNLASVLHIGIRNVEYFDGKMQELVLYSTALSSGTRTTAAANINAYYAIY